MRRSTPTPPPPTPTPPAPLPAARSGRCLGLLAAAAEDPWIAALEAHDALPGQAALDEQPVDLLLIEAGAARSAQEPLRRRRRVQLDDQRVHQMVGDDHIGAREA